MLMTLIMGGLLLNLSRQGSGETQRDSGLSLDAGWRD
jgi:hypothetical protein